MEEKYRDKIVSADLCWTILNNLEQFNDKSELIVALRDKMNLLAEHPIIGTFRSYFEKIVEKYEETKKFPDMAWLDLNYGNNKPIKITNYKYSPIIYEDLTKYLDREILRQDISNKILDVDTPTPSDFRELAQRMSRYCDTAVEQAPLDKQSIINMYTNYKKTYKGVKTLIPELDDLIGCLGFKSLSVIAAPSGTGKSTLATTLAYNVAVKGGLCVDYITFEIPEEHMWFNLTSMESQEMGYNIPASKMKEATLTEEESVNFTNSSESLLNKLNKSGGYIKVLDQTRASADTFEELCNKLESMAEERGRKADLIIIDNVDNLKVLRSSERDVVTKVNNFIIKLDAFSKTYCNGDGTAICLLSQVNRGGVKKFQTAEQGESKSQIDYTVVQQFNSLIERSTVLLCLYSDERMRGLGRINIYPVKLRNRGSSSNALKLPAQFAFSHIGGILEAPMEEEVESITTEELEEDVCNICDDEDEDNQDITE